jgi:hypothetical protein
MFHNRFKFLTLAFSLLTLSACASLSGGRDSSFTCSYETVWDITADTMKGYSITSQDKENGRIETAWLEMEGKKRTFGIFGREGFGNRERAHLTVSVKNTGAVSSVNVIEIRQRWHARGGASSQAARWWPIEPSEEVMDEITDELRRRLKERGCVISS